MRRAVSPTSPAGRSATAKATGAAGGGFAVNSFRMVSSRSNSAAAAASPRAGPAPSPAVGTNATASTITYPSVPSFRTSTETASPGSVASYAATRVPRSGISAGCRWFTTVRTSPRGPAKRTGTFVARFPPAE